MERIDAVLLGAESVLENGGIINKVFARLLSIIVGKFLDWHFRNCYCGKNAEQKCLRSS